MHSPKSLFVQGVEVFGNIFTRYLNGVILGKNQGMPGEYTKKGENIYN